MRAMNSTGDFETTCRNEIIRVLRIVTDQNMIRSSDGNISIRLDEDRYLMTPSGVYKMATEPEDLLVVDGHNQVISGKPGLHPTSEMQMHLEAYRQRPDIRAVLHAHPPYATALTISGIPFPYDLIPEVMLALGEVPTCPYATPGSKELAESITVPIRNHNAVLLSHHGSLNVGQNLEEALIGLERLEHAAHTFALAQSFGKIIPLPADEIEHLRDLSVNLIHLPR
jgi:L-fuculose-phosphate aldolase